MKITSKDIKKVAAATKKFYKKRGIFIPFNNISVVTSKEGSPKKPTVRRTR